MWLSVIATTLVVVAVFLPLTMVPGMAGILFRELGWIVTIVVCVSTTAAISLTPMMSAYMLKLEGGVHDYKGWAWSTSRSTGRSTWLDNALCPGAGLGGPSPADHGLLDDVAVRRCRWGC